MPKMPYQTARFALSCPERPPSDWMKRTAATSHRDAADEHDAVDGIGT